MKQLTIVFTILLSGCIPDMPEIPEMPQGVICSTDGFVMRPIVDSITNISDLQLVLDENGAAMTCVFTYGEA